MNQQSRFLSSEERRQFEAEKPSELKHADIWMISGCQDVQCSADISNTHGFELPDPAGKACGACTATLLHVLYEYEKNPWKEYTFADVLDKMRQVLKQKGFHQVPQLTSTRPISLGETQFKIVPDQYQELSNATKRAVLIGINYKGHKKGELFGCHNDAFNMYNYIQDFYGFQDQDVVVLADDGDHPLPTKAAILQAYRHVVTVSKPGDSIFLHYSGHGTKVKDLNGDEDDGYDEGTCVVIPSSCSIVLLTIFNPLFSNNMNRDAAAVVEIDLFFLLWNSNHFTYNLNTISLIPFHSL